MRYLKGYPSQLPAALSCLLAAQDASPVPERWKMLVKCLSARLPELAASRSAKVSNLINAQTLPTLRTLGLAEFRAENTRLTYRGWYLAKVTGDPRTFKLNLAAVLLQRDNDTWGLVPIIEQLRSYPGEPVPIFEIAIALAKRGVDPCQRFGGIPEEKKRELRSYGATPDGNSSRLVETLKFYNFADILRRAEGTVTLLDSTVERARSAFSEMVNPQIEIAQFFKELKNDYHALAKRFKTPFVPIIPYIRESVCRSLHIDGDRFDNLLNEVVPEHEDQLILLSPAASGVPKDFLFSRQGGRYYYLSMYPKSRSGVSG